MSSPLKLPVKSTFKKSFLGGDGQLEISTDEGLWTTLFDEGKPFAKNVDRVAEINVGGGTGRDLQLGQRQGIKLSVSADASAVGGIRLIWPPQQDPLLERYGLKPGSDQVYLDLTLRGQGSAAANAKFPTGNLPLSASFGFAAGGHMDYSRLVPYPQTDPARKILKDLLGGVRLPQRATSVDEIPAQGEVLVMTYGGYLSLNAAVTAGYTLHGVRGTKVQDLSLALEYSLRAAAGLDLGYRLAGDFSVEARRGSDDGWVRFVVRKNRERQFNFAADFSLDADLTAHELPNTADEFLSALLGTDARSWIDTLGKVRQFSDLDELKQKLDELALSFIEDHAKEWLGEALSDANLQKFFEIAQEVVDAYNNLDERIIQLYEKYLDKIPELTGALDKLASVTAAEGFKKIAAEAGEAWKIVELFFGDRLYDLLVEKVEEFEDYQKLIAKAREYLREDVPNRVRDFIAGVKEKYKLDKIFGQLEKVSSPAALRNLADEKLRGLIGRIVGKAFDKIKGSEVGAAAEKIRGTLDKIDAFKEKWYEKFKESTQQSFSLRVNYAYSRATSRDALLDVEVNLTKSRGASLARKAARGDFKDALQAYDPTVVRVNKGHLTHKLKKSAQVRVNVFGWEHSGIVNLVQNLDHSIESEPGGLMHLFTLETYLEQIRTRGKQFKEEVQSTFLLRAVGETFQPVGADAPVDEKTRQFLLQTLNELAVQYDVVHRDEKATPEELTQYMELAEFLGLLGTDQHTGEAVSARDVVGDLVQQFPEGLGRVEARYVVRYNDGALRSAFSMESADLSVAARATARQLIGAKYTALPRNFHIVDVGFAYLDPQIARRFKAGDLQVNDPRAEVLVPAWFNPDGRARRIIIGKTKIQLVRKLFFLENKYVKKLKALDELLGKAVDDRQAVPVKALRKAARDFIGLAAQIDKVAPREVRQDAHANIFFAIFDRLIQIGNPGKAVRQSAMVLDIVPPGADESQKITKIFTS